MAAVGISATALVETIEPPFVLAMSSAAIISLVLNIKGKRLFNALFWNLLALAVLALLIIDYTLISGSLIVSASRFLAVLLVLKLFDLVKNRDYLLTYLLVFFQILAAAASTISPLFFLILTLFIIGGIWAMIIFNIKKDFQKEFPEKTVVPVAFGAPFFISIVAVSIVSMIMASILFFILPRIGTGFLGRDSSNLIKMTGFSESVDLNAMGPLKKDPTVIMRVGLKSKGPPKRLLYFRGNTLDYYDGTRWVKKVKENTLLKKDARGIFNIIAKGKREPADGDLLEQNILLEPLDTEIIFAAKKAVSIQGDFPSLWVDSTGSMRLPSPPYARLEYKATSDLSEETEEYSVEPAYKDATYLEKDPAGPRVKALVDEIIKGEKTDSEKAGSIERYLRSNYAYSLDPVRGKGGSPLEDFLFYSKQGYCQHYATAMVIMLRASGIGARMVTGFLQGEWNSLGNYFIVRQEDAHSWVEAYIEGKGWVTFDPTPEAGLTALSRQSMISLYLDLLRWRWNRYVIHFTFADQKKVAESIKGRTSWLLNALKSKLHKSRAAESVRLVIISFTAVTALVATYYILRRLPAQNKKAPPFYFEMEKIMRKKGFIRKPAETPLEFAARTDRSEAKEVTEAFQFERYGKGILTNEDLDKVRKAIDALRKD